MLTEAIIQTSNPTSLKIGGASPDEILILESISGLSDVKVQQFTGDFAREGSYYQGRRAEKRNAVFNFKIKPNYRLDIEASDIREMIYRMFMEPQRDSDAVQVVLKDDRRPDRYFLGYTETIAAPIFEKDLKAQCSLNTTDAYLRSVDMTTAENALGWFVRPMFYEGSADTGLEMSVKVLYSTDQVTLANGTETMVFDRPFEQGDVLSVSTIQGERFVKVNGVDAMSAYRGKNWLQIKEQGNVFKTYGTVPSDGKAALVSYSYRAAWWGI